MNLKKNTLLSLAMLTLLGCTQTEQVKEADTLVFTQTEIDLMIAKAKADERERIARVLESQEKKKKAFDEMLIARGEQPRFSEYYQNIAKPQDKKQRNENAEINELTILKTPIVEELNSGNKNKLKLPLQPKINNRSKWFNLIEVDENSLLRDNRVDNKEGGLSKIKPTARGVFFYRNIRGIDYFYCTADSVVPLIINNKQISYQDKNTELSATLCKKNRNSEIILSLQEKLFELGYLKSEVLEYKQLVDGIWGKTTLEAVIQYQIDYGLLKGQLTIQMLEHIGVFAHPVKNSKE